MIKNRIKKFIILSLAMNLCFSAFSTEITLGGKDGWPQFQSQTNITKGKGRFGYDCIQLATNSFTKDSDTDLLIDFENPGCPIATGSYQIVKNNLKTSNQTIMAKNAGLSRNMGGLNIVGDNGTFFGSEGLMGSFSIEFWLCPSIAENGEVIMNWESSRNIRQRLLYQLINCSFNKGHLKWTLSNIFDSYSTESEDVVLEGISKIIPDTWSYHALSYDCETGVLEYLVNGKTEAICYMTSTKREGGEVYLVSFGAKAEVEFCSEYTGKIDDIRILRRPYSIPDYQSAEVAGKVERLLYQPKGGHFITRPIVVSTGSKLTNLIAEMNVPAQTEVSFFVRSGDNYYNWTDSYPAWKPVTSGKDIKDVKGMYFQIACYIYPDGDGTITPTITQIKLDFEEMPLPLPPFTVKAEAGNGSVTLSWSYSVDDTAGGYYIYYGTRPGEYLGRFAVEGDSPINAGNTTTFKITGLENGKIYYFAIASWSSLDDRIIGPLSKEVYARPLSRLK
jgi:hypothetical protein